MGDSRTSVFVSNLKANTSDAEFVSYFRRNCAGVAYGPDAGQISRDNVGRSKGFGFINFIDSLSARAAVSRRNHVIDGRRVYCKLARSYSNGPLHRRKLHVGNMNIGTSKDQLKDYFSKYGQVLHVYIQLDEIDRSCSYGFVEFASLSVLDKIQAERPHNINNKDVQTSRTYPKGVPKHLKRASTILFVSNNKSITKEDIETYFSSYKILSVLENAEYVEICFADYDDVDKICLQGETHYVKDSRVIVSKSLEDLQKKLSGDSDAESESAEPSAPSLSSLSPSRGTSFEMTAMNRQQLYNRKRKSSSQRSSSYRNRYKSSEKNDCCVIL